MKITFGYYTFIILEILEATSLLCDLKGLNSFSFLLLSIIVPWCNFIVCHVSNSKGHVKPHSCQPPIQLESHVQHSTVENVDQGQPHVKLRDFRNFSIVVGRNVLSITQTFTRPKLFIDKIFYCGTPVRSTIFNQQTVGNTSRIQSANSTYNTIQNKPSGA